MSELTVTIHDKPDYQKIHDDMLNRMKEKLLGSTISQKLELKAISNKKIDEVIAKMNTILDPKKVWEDFNFRTGKIMGILRSIAQNPTKRQQLLEVTGLSQTHVDLYFEVVGNLPFPTNDNTINPGRHMDVEATKEFITLVGLHFGYVVEEADLADITEERWMHLYNNALERCAETIKHREEHADEVPLAYEE